MRRSLEPRVRSQGEVLFEASSDQPLRAEIVNVSLGGVCARGILPAAWGRAGEHVLRDMTLRLEDGAPPLVTRARIAWVRDEERSFGLCFGELGGEERDRLSAVVSGHGDAALPTVQRPVRLRLDGGPVLRAAAESTDERGTIVCAELPWLRLGGGATCELDGQEQCGHIDWVGMDVSPAGAARLRLRIALDPPGRVRRDATLPYFSSKLDAHVEAPEALSALAPTEETPAPSAMLRVSALVRLGERRRVRMGLLRVAVGLLTISALLLLVRAMRSADPAPSAEAATSVGEPAGAPSVRTTAPPSVEAPQEAVRADPAADPKAELATPAPLELRSDPPQPIRLRPRPKRPRASSRGR